MLDLIVGRPSLSWRRKESYAILILSFYCLLSSGKHGPRLLWIRKLNRFLQRFSPWQIIAATFSILYALQNLDKLLGLESPDLSAGQLYSSDYNRATWIVTALDAGFATAMSIQPKWFRDICSVIFSVYYIFRGDEADTKLTRLRELSTLEVLRTTWNKTGNFYLRALSAPFRPRVNIRRKLVIQRPKDSLYTEPVTAWLFFVGSELELKESTELILDFPGGGFVAMDPTHHEERLRAWTRKSKRPVLSVDYGKAPEHPYPFAIDECFDLYCTLANSSGSIIGMSGRKLRMVLSGDSAGGNIAMNVMFKIQEYSQPLPHPAGIALTYAALNFSFGSWAWPSRPTPAPSTLSLTQYPDNDIKDLDDSLKINVSTKRTGRSYSLKHIKSQGALLSSSTILPPSAKVVIGSLEEERRKFSSQSKSKASGSVHFSSESVNGRRSSSSSPHKSVVHQQAHTSLFEQRQAIVDALGSEAFLEDSLYEKRKGDISKEARRRLTMSSKVGYMHDRIINPSMMWAMCLLYLGEHPVPGVEKDFRLSPLLAPNALLAGLPPLLLQCGARDPLIDDTVLFGGRVRAAKKEAASAKGKEQQMTPPELDTERQRFIDGGREGGEEDVTVQIFPGWSHGYLQMTMLMCGASVAIDDIADWIISAFEKARMGEGGLLLDTLS